MLPNYNILILFYWFYKIINLEEIVASWIELDAETKRDEIHGNGIFRIRNEQPRHRQAISLSHHQQWEFCLTNFILSACIYLFIQFLMSHIINLSHYLCFYFVCFHSRAIIINIGLIFIALSSVANIYKWSTAIYNSDGLMTHASYVPNYTHSCGGFVIGYFLSLLILMGKLILLLLFFCPILELSLSRCMASEPDRVPSRASHTDEFEWLDIFDIFS